MGTSLNPWRSFLRWRRGRGFGIHSPFAFRFVTEVLRQPCPYYAYSGLDRHGAARLLVRLVAAFQPRRVALMGCGDEYRRALALADSRLQVSTDPAGADFVIADCAKLSPAEQAAIFLAEPRPHAMLLNCRPLPDIRDFGMTFSNSHGTVVVASYPHLPRQHFELKF